jgi:D-alanyl-lipoteichoic acid acyltransferase DltB (MBOAT superfamily)
MAVCSLGFLLFCAAAVLVFQIAPGKRSRQVVLACVSASFFVPLVPDLPSAVWFALMLAGTYVALVLVRARPRGALVAALVTLGLLLYLYLKRFTLFADFVPVPREWDLRLHPVELVGLSYMIFKFIHMLVDQWQGQLAPFNLWTYLNYQLSFFTLMAGPIQRYSDFLRYWEQMDLEPGDARESLRHCNRLLMGMIKVGVLGAYAYSLFRSGSYPHKNVTLGEALLCFYAYPVYLYFNFSGYTDIMLGAGGLLGFRLPENFNRPWLARNVLDFWDRWHISLTHWIRDYVFMASYKVAATKFPDGARYWSYALLFFALFVAGIWHGTTDGFVVFGVLNGLGAAATRAYGDVLRATLGRQRLHAYLKSQTVRLIAIVVTLHYVCLCQLFFSSSYYQAMKILGAAGTELVRLPSTLSYDSWRGPTAAMVVVAVLLIALWKSDAAGSIMRRLALRSGERTGWLAAILFAQCVFVAGMFFVEWVLQQEPPPVLYMAF